MIPATSRPRRNFRWNGRNHNYLRNAFKREDYRNVLPFVENGSCYPRQARFSVHYTQHELSGMAENNVPWETGPIDTIMGCLSGILGNIQAEEGGGLCTASGAFHANELNRGQVAHAQCSRLFIDFIHASEENATLNPLPDNERAGAGIQEILSICHFNGHYGLLHVNRQQRNVTVYDTRAHPTANEYVPMIRRILVLHGWAAGDVVINLPQPATRSRNNNLDWAVDVQQLAMDNGDQQGCGPRLVMKMIELVNVATGNLFGAIGLQVPQVGVRGTTRMYCIKFMCRYLHFFGVTSQRLRDGNNLILNLSEPYRSHYSRVYQDVFSQRINPDVGEECVGCGAAICKTQSFLMQQGGHATGQMQEQIKCDQVHFACCQKRVCTDCIDSSIERSISRIHHFRCPGCNQPNNRTDPFPMYLIKGVQDQQVQRKQLTILGLFEYPGSPVNRADDRRNDFRHLLQLELLHPDGSNEQGSPSRHVSPDSPPAVNGRRVPGHVIIDMTSDSTSMSSLRHLQQQVRDRQRLDQEALMNRIREDLGSLDLRTHHYPTSFHLAQTRQVHTFEYSGMYFAASTRATAEALYVQIRRLFTVPRAAQIDCPHCNFIAHNFVDRQWHMEGARCTNREEHPAHMWLRCCPSAHFVHDEVIEMLGRTEVDEPLDLLDPLACPLPPFGPFGTDRFKCEHRAEQRYVCPVGSTMDLFTFFARKNTWLETNARGTGLPDMPLSVLLPFVKHTTLWPDNALEKLARVTPAPTRRFAFGRNGL